MLPRNFKVRSIFRSTLGLYWSHPFGDQTPERIVEFLPRKVRFDTAIVIEI